MYTYKDNNHVSNLRIVTNRYNASKDKINTSTGLLGVYYRAKSDVYETSIRVQGQKTYLGSTTNPYDTQVMYLTAVDYIENSTI